MNFRKWSELPYKLINLDSTTQYDIPGQPAGLPMKKYGPDRMVDLYSFKLIWSIYSPIGAKIEISFEKDFSVRISCRTLAQSIPEGLENKMALGAKIKKNYEIFFTIP